MRTFLSKTLLVCLVSLVPAFTAVTHAQNILLNSSFETGTNTAGNAFPSSTAVSNWTVGLAGGAQLPYTSGGSPLTNTNYSQEAGGSKGVSFLTDNGINYFRQSVTLTSGTIYQAAMDVVLTGQGNAGNAVLDVYVASVGGTTPLQSFAFSTAATNTASMSTSWTSFGSSNLTFTQATGTYDFVYRFTAPNSVAKDINLDRASLVAVVVPEANTAALLALALPMIGTVAVARRKRTA